MKTFLFLTLFVLAACAPNPNGVREGQWVINQVTGSEYYLIDYNAETGDVELMKDDDGNVVQVDTNILELAPRDIEVDHSDLMHELRLARIALDNANTPVNRAAVEESVKEAERVIATDSDIFRTKVWNPATSRYE